MIHVANIRTFRTAAASGVSAYVGRAMPNRPGSVLGNPYRIDRDKANDERERNKVLNNYKVWLWAEIRKQREVWRELRRLARIAQTEDLHLLCFCHPRSCHAEGIKAAIEWILREDGPLERLIIAGGRDYRLTPADYEKLDNHRLGLQIAEVVSGCATGADSDGAAWARKHFIHVEPFPADWTDLSHPDAVIKTRADGTQYDARCGPRRNAAMAAYADAVVLFPGGRGTRDMYDAAKAAGLRIYDWRTNGEAK